VQQGLLVLLGQLVLLVLLELMEQQGQLVLLVLLELMEQQGQLVLLVLLGPQVLLARPVQPE
jgi:hypothetical protein